MLSADEIKSAFSLLEIEPTNSSAAIKAAYRKAAKRWHPDKFQSSAEKQEAHSQFIRLKGAYDLICKALSYPDLLSYLAGPNQYSTSSPPDRKAQSKGSYNPPRSARPSPPREDRKSAANEEGRRTANRAKKKDSTEFEYNSSFNYYKNSYNIYLIFIIVFVLSGFIFLYHKNTSTSVEYFEDSYNEQELASEVSIEYLDSISDRYLGSVDDLEPCGTEQNDYDNSGEKVLRTLRDRIDMNDDGVKDSLIEMKAMGICGSGGCSIEIHDGKDGRFVGRVPFSKGLIVISGKIDHGYRRFYAADGPWNWSRDMGPDGWILSAYNGECYQDYGFLRNSSGTILNINNLDDAINIYN